MAAIEPEITPADVAPPAPQGPSPEQIVAQRQLAVAQAGVNIGTPIGAMFSRGYDGALDDPEAIRQAAILVGAFQAPEAPAAVPDLAQPAEGQAQTREAFAAGAESYTPPAPEPERDPRVVIIEEGLAARAMGDTDDTVMASAFNKLLHHGYSEGDQRKFSADPNIEGSRQAERIADWERRGLGVNA